jgi:hypothetical protein
MKQYSTYSSRASLAGVGMLSQRWGVWHVLAGQVRIKQKVLKYRPVDKLQDCFINMLAGGAGVVETNPACVRVAGCSVRLVGGGVPSNRRSVTP